VNSALNPEERARVLIDERLAQAGWTEFSAIMETFEWGDEQ